MCTRITRPSLCWWPCRSRGILRVLSNGLDVSHFHDEQSSSSSSIARINCRLSIVKNPRGLVCSWAGSVTSRCLRDWRAGCRDPGSPRTFDQGSLKIRFGESRRHRLGEANHAWRSLPCEHPSRAKGNERPRALKALTFEPFWVLASS